jgi:glycoprotein 6-alpha-L-fucosyltransferase
MDNYGTYRKEESIKLGNLIQNRFKLLQNPNNCTNSKKLLCNINKPCGFGCQFHHLILCFVTAYATNRVMIMDSSNWLAQFGEGYTYFFQPVSDNCKNFKIKSNIMDWNGMHFYNRFYHFFTCL